MTPLTSTPVMGALQERPVAGMFGLWAWGDWNDGMRVLSEAGFDLAVDVSSRNGLRMAKEWNLSGVIDNFGFDPKMLDDEKLWQEFLVGVKQKVLELRDHPAVFGWYLVDEPDWRNLPIEKIRTMTNLVRSLDPGHPLITVVTLPDKWAPYLPYFDIIGIDPYLRTNRFCHDQPEKVRTWIRQVRWDMTSLNLHKPLWVVLGAFDLKPRDQNAPPSGFYKPTPAQMEEMVSICLEEEVEGIFIWILALKNHRVYRDWNLPRDDPGLWDVVRSIPARIKAVYASGSVDP